jgi:hypothetical protein
LGHVSKFRERSRFSWRGIVTSGCDLLPQNFLRILGTFVLQRQLLLPPKKVPPSLFARNRPLIVYSASLEIQREEAHEQLDIG